MDNFYYLSQSSNMDVFASLKCEITNLQNIRAIEEVTSLNVDYEKNPPFVFVDIRDIDGPISALLDPECFAYYVIIDSNYNNAQDCLRMAREVNIRDYINAPFTQYEIQDCIDRFYHCLALRKAADKNNLVIKEKGAHIYIETRSIKLLEGFGSYTRIHTADKIYIVSKTIKKILELLPNQFIRTHRSFAVHQKQLRSLMGNTLLLHNGEQVKVSKSGRQVILDHFNKAS
jgi:DNA-binding LytR/AlgR family response regulator